MRTATQKQNRRHLASVTLVAAALLAGVTATAPAGAATAEPVSQSAGVVAQASWPIVKSGQRGVDVETVQLLLTARGYPTGADGIFGSGTAAKVKQFQKSRGLAADGVVGPNTWSKLVMTVKSGVKSPAVKAAQRQLSDNGFAVSADGAFGPATAEKVRAFQKAKGLAADGVVGPNTWARLVNGGGGGGGNPGGAVQLVFDKNQSDQTNSRLSVVRGGKTIASYRAGSGRDNNKDECAKSRGWLPNGTYDIKGHTKRHPGKVIRGYAIELENMKCANGTERTELFVHSEMTINGTQGSIERERWTDSNPVDFESLGCIKIRPTEIQHLFNVLDKVGWPKSLQVIS
ncbi:peptidoglycan-binding protein [Streptomyces sp. CA-210063]|uniref:L,D-transpeptidase family protein n=1 Tax=Streptomyces sp. CA-210063 TaxID=2801029 RepID=UPI00214CB1FB|nr:peptidoglycan-binding protein [Streptomyces sp. CA-210063]UUU31846.1 peptidoglycan-binding protein [Streptomyces sp. CA-210063]